MSDERYKFSLTSRERLWVVISGLFLLILLLVFIRLSSNIESLNSTVRQANTATSIPTFSPGMTDPLTSNSQTEESDTVVIFLVDKSRSTAFDGQIELEREIVRDFINSQKPENLVAVVGFDSTPFVVVKLDRVSAVLSSLDYRLGNLVAMGKSDIFPAWVEGCRILSKVKAKRKHVFILTDGKIPLSDTDDYKKLDCLTELGAKVSTVGIGAEPDVPFLEFVSNRGKGIYLHAKNKAESVEKLLAQARN